MDEKRLQELKKHAELAATLQDESLNLIAAAHCVNGIPELLAEIRAQAAEIERLRAWRAEAVEILGRFYDQDSTGDYLRLPDHQYSQKTKEKIRNLIEQAKGE